MNRRGILIGGLLVLATVAVYWPLTSAQFILYDDPVYVTQNPVVQRGLSREGMVWAFKTGLGGSWHPVTWLSHMLDVQLYGGKPLGHHLTNLALHAGNALLLFALLRRLTGATWRSAFVAALFALHPLHVESVAWVSERKDVLSALFFFLTVWAYGRYVEVSGVRCRVSGEGESKAQSSKFKVQSPKSNVEPGYTPVSGSTLDVGRWTLNVQVWSPAAWYSCALVLFTLGLMSKPMVVTLPLVLLLLDYWPLGRFGVQSPKSKVQSPKLVPNEVPASRITHHASPTHSPIHPFTDLTHSRFTFHVSRFTPLLLEKLPFLLLAATASWVTLLTQRGGGMVGSLEMFPLRLRLANCLVAYAAYLRKLFLPVDLAVFYPYPRGWPTWEILGAGLLLAAISVAVFKLRRRCGYLVTGWLLYAVMLLPVIGLVQAGSQCLADRYTYVPMIGCLVMLTWGGYELARARGWSLRALGAMAVLVLAGCGVATRIQAGYWKSTETLFAHALAVTENNYLAEVMLGSALSEAGKENEATVHFEAALRIKPDYARAYAGLGKLMLARADAAVRRGAVQEAVGDYREALRFDPELVAAMNNLAWILATHSDDRVRNGAEAVALAERAALLTRRQSVTALDTLGAAYAEAGRFAEALKTVDEALNLARASGKTNSVPELNAMRRLYEQGRPYRNP
jgi:Flp pilus assembly protein TadD